MDWRDLQTQWNGDIASITPLHDFVLVKPLPGEGMLIIDPGVKMTKDGRWRLDNRKTGNITGEVVAVGRGDKLADGRGPMNVKVGDIVVIPQIPANVAVINDEEYIFAHEEQHVMAVLEAA